jgi:mitochondrial enoyl-[acyl-carrier protein] reductase / trans-2-enoyl-CoA reductase
VVLVDGADLASRVADATGDATLSLALDGVAGAAMPSLSGCLSPGGTLVVYAFMSEQPGQVNSADLIFRRVTIRGFWLESPAVRGSPKVLEAIKTGARLIAEGTLHLPIAAVYPLSAAQAAITHAQRGGKVLFACS